MEMLNNAFAGADAFKKMLEKTTAEDSPMRKLLEGKQAQAEQVKKGPNFENRSGDHESRAERRERERFEAKQASRIARGLGV